MNLVKLIIKKISRNEKGGAILEFAIVVPILLALSLGGYEFSRSLKILQVGSTLSREAANLAFRKCAIDTGTALDNCLHEIATEMVNFSRVTIPNVSIVLSSWNSGTPAVRRSIQAATSSTEYDADIIEGNSNESCGTASASTSPFSRICLLTDTTQIGFKDVNGAANAVAFTPATLLADHGIIISAESYIEYQPIVGAIGSILNIQGHRYYDATLL